MFMKGPKLTRRRFMAGIAAAPFASLGHAWGIEPEWIRVKRLRLAETPVARFVHITDLHHRGDRQFLEKAVSIIKKLAPDFLCFTGDLIEEAEHAPEALELLSKAGCPLYGIPGNHDHWADLDFDLPRQSFAATGGAWLMNEEVDAAGGRVRLFGLSGLDHFDFKPLPARKNVLLCHYPSSIDSYGQTRFDLVLAGHSHGGQIRLPGYGAIIVPFGVGEYQMGLYETHAGPLYVNPGLGWFYANLRLFCRPEVTVIEI